MLPVFGITPGKFHARLKTIALNKIRERQRRRFRQGQGLHFLCKYGSPAQHEARSKAGRSRRSSWRGESVATRVPEIRICDHLPVLVETRTGWL